MLRSASPESLATRVDEIVQGGENELARLDHVMANLNWKSFVHQFMRAQWQVAETHHFHISERKKLEKRFEAASYDIGVVSDEGRVNVTDLFISGYEVVVKNGEGTYSKEPRFVRGDKALKIEAADCDIHAVPLNPQYPKDGIKEIGLELVEIYSGDKELFSGYDRIFIPASNLARR